ncbi:MAG: hypothetical protein J4G04_05765 [Nitrosopumilaceae archaeon]|nr:hypothetical protein [Nitrosopumilaceae archaeon]
MVNYATGTDEPVMLPLAKMCSDEDKCIIRIRSDMRAYIYGPAGFRHKKDVLRMCRIFGWCSRDMLGRLDTADVAVAAKDAAAVKESFSISSGPPPNQA